MSEDSSSGDYYTSSSDIETSSEDAPAPFVPKVYPNNYDMHNFTFSTKERAVPEVDYPAIGFLKDSEFKSSEGKLQLENIKNHLAREGRLSFNQAVYLLETVSDLFCGENNVLMLDAPLTICGDIHGQFYDLLELFNVSGDPADVHYLFLGDYVDRGNFSCEVVFLLYAYKINYPKTFHMIRGNHECRHLTEFFSFKEECLHKYDLQIYDTFMDSFDTLPLCAILNKQFFCVHGGISPSIQKLDEINVIDRFREPPSSGPMCDLLWSDPHEEKDFMPGLHEEFTYNHHRGCSYNFSFDAVANFVERNNLLCVIRAHEVQQAGYKMMRKNPKTGFPSLITLFSAPNYCESYHNKAAVLKYENNIINIKQFQEVDQPYYLPNFMNVIQWSLPFVSLKIADVLTQLYKLVDDEAAEEIEKIADLEKAEEENKIKSIRTKIKTFGRVMGVLGKIRRQREQTLKYAQFAINGVVPEHILNMDEDQLATLTSTIEGQKSIDASEKRPNIDEDSFDEKYASKGTRVKGRLQRSSSIDNIMVNQEHKEAPEIYEELSNDDEKITPIVNIKRKTVGSRFVQSTNY